MTETNKMLREALLQVQRGLDVAKLGLNRDGVQHAKIVKLEGIVAEVLSAPTDDANLPALQRRVREWTLECFGDEIACDLLERMDRFTEEALELVQALGYDASRAHALVDYVFGREKGSPPQEVGGTMTTLAALCNVAGIDIQSAFAAEVDRITRPEIVIKIRAKQAAKPTGSALPIALSKAEGRSLSSASGQEGGE